MGGQSYERQDPQNHHIECRIKETGMPDKAIEMRTSQNYPQNKRDKEGPDGKDEERRDEHPVDFVLADHGSSGSET